MKLKALALAAAIAGLTGLMGCETMSAEECATADWEALGLNDAAQNGSSRYEARATSCGEHGALADAGAYQRGFDAGMYQFCRPENGFALARRGGTFSGACPYELQEEFGYAYTDGQRVRDAEQALAQVENELSSLRSERSEIDDNIGSHERQLAEATTDEVRARHRNEIERLQRERRRVNDDIRVAQAQAPSLRREVDALRYEIGSRWGDWR
jgi:hypothetical protein